MMAYDYSKLLGRIVEKYGTRKAFAEAMGMAERTLSRKLGNKAHFPQDEISRACELLSIEAQDMTEYFFCRR